MIGFLKGSIISSSPEVTLIDVSGVGYEVHIPLSTFYAIQGLQKGADVTLNILTIVREDAITLYGFWTLEEKDLFRRLISVSGVGPKLASGILSGLPPADFVRAILDENIAALKSIPGVGKKTAERLALEMRDKVKDLSISAPNAALPPADEDLVLALVGLGYKRNVAVKAVKDTRLEEADLSPADLLKASLKRLAGL